MGLTELANAGDAAIDDNVAEAAAENATLQGSLVEARGMVVEAEQRLESLQEYIDQQNIRKWWGVTICLGYRGLRFSDIWKMYRLEQNIQRLSKIVLRNQEQKRRAFSTWRQWTASVVVAH